MNYCSDVSDDDRQTDRQTGRQAGRQTDRQTDRQAGRQTDLAGLISNEFLLQLSGTKREPTYTRAHNATT